MFYDFLITIWFLVCKHTPALTFRCVQIVIEILRNPVSSLHVLFSDFQNGSNDGSASEPPAFVVLHRNSGQLLFCVQAEDPEELRVCVYVCVRALVYTSAAMKHVFPSHSTPLSQPLSHSVVLFSKDFSVARARDPAVFPSHARSQTRTFHKHFFVSLSTPLPSVCHVFCLSVSCSVSFSVSLSLSLPVSTPPIPT